jgi:hypothetical protein
MLIAQAPTRRRIEMVQRLPVGREVRIDELTERLNAQSSMLNAQCLPVSIGWH